MPYKVESIDPMKTALIVVDMQNDFVAPGAPLETPTGRTMLPNLKRAITSIEFSADGLRAFIGASDGVREVSVEDRRVVAELTKSPVRQLLRSPDGSKLVVLEHDVSPGKDGKPAATPFRASRRAT